MGTLAEPSIQTTHEAVAGVNVKAEIRNHHDTLSNGIVDIVSAQPNKRQRPFSAKPPQVNSINPDRPPKPVFL